MNLLHLRYALKAAEKHSFSKAAEALSMSQPNLSRGIKDLEEAVGITIFDRTAKGIFPTPEGEKFLSRAKKIIQDIDDLENTYNKQSAPSQKISIASVKADYIAFSFAEFSTKISLNADCQLTFCENSVKNVIDSISEGKNSLGIVRCPLDYLKNFTAIFEDRELAAEVIKEGSIFAVMSENNLAAKEKELTLDKLSSSIEISCESPYVPGLPPAVKNRLTFTDNKKHIAIYDMAGAIAMLCYNPHTYMWSSMPLPSTLSGHRLKAIPCKDYSPKYCDLLIFRNGHKFTPLEILFLNILNKNSELAK